MTDLEKECTRLRNLRQNKKRSLTEIEKEAKINVFTKQIDIEARFKNPNDKKLAKKIFDHYITNHNFNTFVEYKVVADLVFEEILLEHLKDTLDQVSNDDNNIFIPEKSINALHDTQERVYFLQKKLGIIKADKSDSLTEIEMLKKKFNIFIPFNRNEFTAWIPTLCPNCGHFDVQGRLMRRRVKDFDCLIHPAFSGRFLYNCEIIDDVKNEKITKEQAAKYLRTSPKYIEWAIENETKIISIDGVPEQSLRDYITANPNLRNPDFYNLQ